jgi:hypothetical protein
MLMIVISSPSSRPDDTYKGTAYEASFRISESNPSKYIVDRYPSHFYTASSCSLQHVCICMTAAMLSFSYPRPPNLVPCIITVLLIPTWLPLWARPFVQQASTGHLIRRACVRDKLTEARGCRSDSRYTKTTARCNRQGLPSDHIPFPKQMLQRVPA